MVVGNKATALFFGLHWCKDVFYVFWSLTKIAWHCPLISLVSIWSARICDRSETRSPIGLRNVADTWKNLSRRLRRSTAHDLDDRHVESSSNFPTITTLPTKTIFNGNMGLRWSVSYRRHTIVRLEKRPIRLEVNALLFLLPWQRISSTLVCDRFRFKWRHFPPVFAVVCDKTDADSFRWSQTVADHMETSLYGVRGHLSRNNHKSKWDM